MTTNIENFEHAYQARIILQKLHQSVKKNSATSLDLLQLVDNLDRMITRLASLEVEARKTHRYYNVNVTKTQVIAAMQYLEKMMVWSKLMD